MFYKLNLFSLTFCFCFCFLFFFVGFCVCVGVLFCFVFCFLIFSISFLASSFNWSSGIGSLSANCSSVCFKVYETWTYFFLWSSVTFTIQKMKFFIKDFFSKCDQIRSFLQIWSHLLKKSLMETFIFCSAFCLFSK